MATQIVELTGDEVKLLKSLDKVIQKQVEYENRLKETSREGKKAGDDVAGGFAKTEAAGNKAMKEFLRELKQIGPEGRKSAEALEKHLRDSGQAGFKSMDKVLDQIRDIDPEAADAAAAAQRAFASSADDTEKRYRQVLAEMRQLGPAGKTAADQIEREMVAAGKLSSRSMDSVIDKLAEIDPAAAEAARGVVGNLNQIGQQGESTFAGLRESIGSYVAKFTAVTAAVAGLRELWEQVNEEQQKALDALQGTEDADRRILQVSSADEFRQRTQTADNLAAEFGIDRSVVRNVQFSAISEGFEADLRSVLEANQVIAPEAAATVAGQIPQLFAGQGLTTSQALSGGLTAASRSRVDFEELNRALPKAAEGANQLGASYEETIAALAVSAKEFASVDTAGDRIKAFTTALSLDEEGRFKGLDLTQSVEKLRDFSEGERRDFLGNSQELNVAFGVLLRNLDQIKSEAQTIRDDRAETRSGGGLLRERIGTASTDPRLRALAENRRAGIELELAQAEGGEAASEASVAARTVEREFLDTESLGTRIAGRVTSGLVTGLAIEAGADQQTAQGLAATAGRAFSVDPTGIAPRGNVAGGIARLFGFARDTSDEVGNAQNTPASRGPGTLEQMQQQQQRQIELMEQQLELARQQASQPQPLPPPVTPALSAQQP